MDRFTTDPDDEENNNEDPGWGWTIAAAITWGLGVMILIGLAIWAIILWRRVKGIPEPRQCFLSSKDVKIAKESKDYLTEFEKRWNNLMKYDCNECTPCDQCDVPRGTCIGELCGPKKQSTASTSTSTKKVSFASNPVSRSN